MLDKEIGKLCQVFSLNESDFLAVYIDRFKVAKSTSNRTTDDIL